MINRHSFEPAEYIISNDSFDKIVLEFYLCFFVVLASLIAAGINRKKYLKIQKKVEHEDKKTRITKRDKG